MKTTRRYFLLFLLSMAGGFTSPARAAEHAAIQGILIAASNDQGRTDRRLAAYEPTLKRILRFESYRFLGDDRASLEGAGTGHLSLGDGHELVVAKDASEGKSLRVRVKWMKNGRALMNTELVLRPGIPAVLGGPSTGNKDEVYAVIVIGH